MNSSKLLAVAVTIGCAMHTVASAEQAKNFPSKPIRIVVPYTAGATNDALPRAIAPRMEQILGQTVIVENRPGAGGDIGVDHVIRSEADGYTILLTSNAAVTRAVAAGANSKYDVQKDLRPVMLVGDQPMILVTGTDFAANTMQELLAAAKKNPEGLSYGSPGAGTPHQLSSELMNVHADVKMLHVPFKGTAPALIEIAAGRLSYTWGTVASAGPMMKDKRVKALGVTAKQRISEFPDVPTLTESGIPGLESGFWYGLTVPAGTPDAIVNKLYDAARQAVADPAVAERIQGLGVMIDPKSPTEFAQLIADDMQKWTKVVETAGITLE